MLAVQSTGRSVRSARTAALSLRVEGQIRQREFLLAWMEPFLQ